MVIPKSKNVQEIENYESYNEKTDKSIDLADLHQSFRNIGKGTSFDGLPGECLILIPDNLNICILSLLQNIFGKVYPYGWRKQILFPIPKKEHTIIKPKLRGIAIGPLLSRVNDIIINEKFCSWYNPNPEQAGFRKGQG